MYMPVAAPQSRTPASMSATRHGVACTRGSHIKEAFIETPMRTTLLIVPMPGRCRSGIQSSSTAAPTMITNVPIARPR
jgi:hypothetical protein